MKIINLLVALIYLFTSLPVMAYTLVLDETGMPTEQKVVAEGKTSLQYGLAMREQTDAPVKHIALTAPEAQATLPSFVKTAEASGAPAGDLIEAFNHARSTVDQADSLAKIRPVVGDEVYQQLQAKVQAGAHELLVLEMMRQLMPRDVDIYDTVLKGEEAELAAMVQGPDGTIHGVAVMVLEDGVWKLKSEHWFTDEKAHASRLAPIVSKIDPMSSADDIAKRMQWDEPGYMWDDSLLMLSKTPVRFPKDSLTLFFFIEKKEKETRPSDDDVWGEESNKSKPLHVVWRGPRVLVPQQRKYTEEYPVDFSIAHEKEGYMPGHFNLSLPRRKPKQLNAAFLYQF